jgi:hypothetical protein
VLRFCSGVSDEGGLGLGRLVYMGEEVKTERSR